MRDSVAAMTQPGDCRIEVLVTIGDAVVPGERLETAGQAFGVREIESGHQQRDDVAVGGQRVVDFPAQPVALVGDTVKGARRQDQDEMRRVFDVREQTIVEVAACKIVDVEKYAVAPLGQRDAQQPGGLGALVPAIADKDVVVVHGVDCRSEWMPDAKVREDSTVAEA